MSDMAEYHQDKRERKQKKKAEQLKWNSEVVLFLAGELDFEVKQHSEHHFSLFHESKGRLDYWPSTGKAMWLKEGRSFQIPDIEKYLY